MLFITLHCSVNSTMASFGQRFERDLFSLLILAWAFQTNLYKCDKSFSINSSCYQPSLSWSMNGLARQPREVWWQLRICLSKNPNSLRQNWQAEGLPIDSSPLEAAMALAAQEEVRPLHKLSLVRVLAILLKF